MGQLSFNENVYVRRTRDAGQRPVIKAHIESMAKVS